MIGERTETTQFNILCGKAAHLKDRSEDIHEAIAIGCILRQPRFEDCNSLEESVHILEEGSHDVVVCRDLPTSLSV